MTDRCPKYEPDALAKFGDAEDENCQTCLHKEDPYCGPHGAPEAVAAPDELQRWKLVPDSMMGPYMLANKTGEWAQIKDILVIERERNELRDANTYLTDTCETQRKLIERAREVMEFLQGYTVDRTWEKVQKWLDDERAVL